MLSYKQWRLLSEDFGGPYTLGLKSIQPVAGPVGGTGVDHAAVAAEEAELEAEAELEEAKKCAKKCACKGMCKCAKQNKKMNGDVGDELVPPDKAPPKDKDVDVSDDEEEEVNGEEETEEDDVEEKETDNGEEESEEEEVSEKPMLSKKKSKKKMRKEDFGYESLEDAEFFQSLRSQMEIPEDHGYWDGISEPLEEDVLIDPENEDEEK